MARVLTPFSEAVAMHVYPAMARAGLRRKGKRLWWERREDGSWVVLEIQMLNGGPSELRFTVNTAAWPPGTWEHQQTVLTFLAGHEVPYASGAPMWERPNGVAPHLWPCDEDFRSFGRSTDLGRVGEELRDFLLAALEWARERSDVEGAIRGGLHDHWTLAMLRATVPDDPRLAELERKYEPSPDR